MAAPVDELPTLAGARCVLRALRPADAPAIALHANDAALVRNLHDGFPHPYTLAHAQAWCGGQHRELAFGHVWAITVGDAAIGCTGVLPGSGLLACNAEVGYWIGQAFWGRGIAADALGLASAWAWGQLPAVQRLFAPIHARNPASQRVAAKAGYVLGACRTWGGDSEKRPQRGQFLPDLQAHSPAMGPKSGKKWTAEAASQPTIPKSDRLLEARIPRSRIKDGEVIDVVQWAAYRR